MFSRTTIRTFVFALVMFATAALLLNVFTVAAQEQTTVPPIHVDDQVILPGESFGDVVLADGVQARDYPADQLTWTVSGHTALTAHITDGVLSVTPPDPAWLGSETLHVEACDPGGACSATDATFWAMEDSNVDVTVTFVGNSGFMITAGDKKILIDALFSGIAGGYHLPQDEHDLLANALPPFDGIDLILATHGHADHFAADIVCQHMQNDPGVVFVSTPAAAEAVAGKGCPDVIPLDLHMGESAQLIANGIGVEAMFLSHGDPVYQNLGYVITTGGRRIFHMGDIGIDVVTIDDFQGFELPEKNLDIAFIVHFVLNRASDSPLVTEGINARYIFPIHYAFTVPSLNVDRILRVHPDAIFFQDEMDTWTLPD